MRFAVADLAALPGRPTHSGAHLSLSNLPIAFLVPPLNLLPLCFAGLLLLRHRRRIGVAVLATGVCGLTLLGMPVVADELLNSLEHGLPLTPPTDNPPQAIVILSGDVAHGSDRRRLEPGFLTLERERAGAELARRTRLPVLVSGGAVTGSHETLAGMMVRSMAEDFGVPVRWAEAHSDDTWENAADSAAMLTQQHIGSIYLVTHAWHMRRALIAFAATHSGIAITAAPVRIDHRDSEIFQGFVPSVNAWQASYYALHEWIGCADYAWLR